MPNQPRGDKESQIKPQTCMGLEDVSAQGLYALVFLLFFTYIEKEK